MSGLPLMTWFGVCVGAFITAVSVCSLLRFLVDKKKLKRNSFLTCSVSFSVWVVSIAVVFSGLWYEYPDFHPEYGLYVVNKDKTLSYSSWGAFDWGKTVRISTSGLEVSSSVTPITENPKVREVSYTVNFLVSNPDKYYSSFGAGTNFLWNEADKAVINEIFRMVRYQLYEFNDLHSGKLAEFYNPLDEKQQQEFEELLVGFLNEKLDDVGLKYEASFSVH